MSKYYLLYHSEDDTTFQEVEPTAFLCDLAKWGTDGVPFLTDIPPGDIEMWPVCHILIRGEIITPKPKQIVTEYELP